jgi:hypothetical protein
LYPHSFAEPYVFIQTLIDFKIELGNSSDDIGKYFEKQLVQTQTPSE